MTFIKTWTGILFLVLVLMGLSLTPAQAASDVKELKIAIGIDADTLDPIEMTTTLPANICDLITDQLFFQNADGKLEPRLAAKYEVSPDGLTWQIHLRPGVKFSDGTPLNAQAVKAHFDRALDPKQRVPTRFLITSIKSVDTVDDLTLKMVLKSPYAPMAPTLSSTICNPLSPAAVTKYGAEVRRNPVGAGPYKLAEWAPGERIVLVRNEGYYGPKPTVEKIVYQIVPEAATREAMLRAGQVDICYKPLPSNVAALQADPNVAVAMPLDTRAIFMGLNCQKGVTTNKLVRQAFNYAVDKKAICQKVLFDTAVPMEGPVSPILFGYVKMDKQYDYDPGKAKELLKQANFDFGQTVKMRTPNGRYLFDKQVSEAIQAYLQTIGVKVELRTYDWPTYVAGLLKPLDQTELEVFLLGWGPLFLDADFALYGQFHCQTNPPKGLGSAFYCNPAFDKLVDQGRTTVAPEERMAAYREASQMLWDDCPWIWLHIEKFVLAYRSNLEGLLVTNIEKFFPTYCTRK